MKIFRPFSLVALLLTLFSFAKEKTYPFDQWTQAELDRANTAKDVSYLDETEQRVIFYTNLARINPKLFGETYAAKWVDSLGNKTANGKSLVAELKRTAPLGELYPDSVLSKDAQEHADVSGKKGKTGHSGDDKRYAHVKDRFPTWGENCSYGFKEPLAIVMQLLIDDKVPGLGHRKNCLDKRFTHIGVGSAAHKKYKWNCVEDFGG